MSNIIQAYGLFWKAENVFWGTPKNPGGLYGVPSRARRSEPVNFRDQIGIYILYSGHDIIYVGQAGSGKRYLFKRLRSHRRDSLADRWDSFSWFGLRRVLAPGRLAKVNKRTTSSLAQALNHMEAVLISAAEPALNRQGGRFGKQAIRYIQSREKRLGPTDQKMIKDLWNIIARED